MSSPSLLRARGQSGHASMPGIADNALVKAARLVDRIAALRPEPRLLPEAEGFFETVLGEVPEAAELGERLAELDGSIAGMIEPMLSLTVSPTMIAASEKRNVVPAVCDVTCDCRLLPGQTQREAEDAIRGWLGEGDYELRWIEGVGGSRSSRHTPLWEAIARWIERQEPGAALAPIVLPGFTDSHYLREAFGTIAYGFFPMRTMSPELVSRLVHSADERIAVDDLELGTRFLIDLARDVLG